MCFLQLPNHITYCHKTHSANSNTHTHHKHKKQNDSLASDWTENRTGNQLSCFAEPINLNSDSLQLTLLAIWQMRWYYSNTSSLWKITKSHCYFTTANPDKRINSHLPDKERTAEFNSERQRRRDVGEERRREERTGGEDSRDVEKRHTHPFSQDSCWIQIDLENDWHTHRPHTEGQLLMWVTSSNTSVTFRVPSSSSDFRLKSQISTPMTWGWSQRDVTHRDLSLSTPPFVLTCNIKKDSQWCRWYLTSYVPKKAILYGFLLVLTPYMWTVPTQREMLTAHSTEV